MAPRLGRLRSSSVKNRRDHQAHVGSRAEPTLERSCLRTRSANRRWPLAFGTGSGTCGKSSSARSSLPLATPRALSLSVARSLGGPCSCRGMDADLEALDALTEGNLREIIDSWEGFCYRTESLLSGDLSVAADSDEYAASVRALSHYGLTRLVGDHFLQALEVLPPSPSLSPSIVVAIAIALGAPRRTLQRKRGWCLPYAHGYLC